MRFAVAHKAATYLMVGFAYLAMIAGGAIAPLIALAGIVGLVGSWWWEPPNVKLERWAWIWTIASVFALVYSVLSAIVTGDFLGVGAQFLVWLVVAKAYNRRAARDWQQMYLLAFLMLVAGSVLNADLTYGVCFLGFVIATTWAITLFHLRREMEDNLLVKHAADRASERVEVRRILDSKRIVGSRFFVGTGALSFGVFIIASIVFLAIPRVGFGFFLKGHKGLTLSGFNDGVKLGGHGVIKNDSTVVMRVEIDAKYGGRDKPEIHWRGVAFDHYSKGQWTRDPLSPWTKEVPIPMGPYERHDVSWPPDQYSEHEPVKQGIWLDPLDSDVLFGAGIPRTYETAAIARKRKQIPVKNQEMRLDHGETLHYTLESDFVPPPDDELRATSGKLSPTWEHVYEQVPEEIRGDRELYELVDRITAGNTNNYDKAKAIETWLETNLSYTLELADPGNVEPIHFFVFQRKKGHCEYFASAFVIMARIAHIPTRQVNGFLGGEWNEYKGYVAVRAGDAHSWAEVYFPGKGWVTFDPTPAAPGGELGRGGNGWTAKLGRFIDTMRFQWSKWVIEYDLVSQIALFKDVGNAFKRAAVALRDVFKWLLAFWPLVAALVGSIAAYRFWRRRGKADGPLAVARKVSRQRRSPVATAYDEVLKHLAKAGTRRDPGTTPRELATRLTAKEAPAASEIAELTDLYYAAEWGRRSDRAAERRAAELAAQIRKQLAAAAKA
ncbi:MAG TPA: DUF3488 and transglutaminase-like domain-containing protein [Kofleriaceae bacterium]|nr:DUF3488 and transglutaminase-like domain-containing protein [Kofleriaceae bacterium]